MQIIETSQTIIGEPVFETLYLQLPHCTHEWLIQSFMKHKHYLDTNTDKSCYIDIRISGNAYTHLTASLSKEKTQ